MLASALECGVPTKKKAAPDCGADRAPRAGASRGELGAAENSAPGRTRRSGELASWAGASRGELGAGRFAGEEEPELDREEMPNESYMNNDNIAGASDSIRATAIVMAIAIAITVIIMKTNKTIMIILMMIIVVVIITSKAHGALGDRRRRWREISFHSICSFYSKGFPPIH